MHHVRELPQQRAKCSCRAGANFQWVCICAEGFQGIQKVDPLIFFLIMINSLAPRTPLNKTRRFLSHDVSLVGPIASHYNSLLRGGDGLQSFRNMLLRVDEIGQMCYQFLLRWRGRSLLDYYHTLSGARTTLKHTETCA